MVIYHNSTQHDTAPIFGFGRWLLGMCSQSIYNIILNHRSWHNQNILPSSGKGPKWCEWYSHTLKHTGESRTDLIPNTCKYIYDSTDQTQLTHRPNYNNVWGHQGIRDTWINMSSNYRLHKRYSIWTMASSYHKINRSESRVERLRSDSGYQMTLENCHWSQWPSGCGLNWYYLSPWSVAQLLLVEE